MYGDMRARFNATIKEWTRQETKLEQLEIELQDVLKLEPETEAQERHKADEVELLNREMEAVRTTIRVLQARSQSLDAAMVAAREENMRRAEANLARARGERNDLS